MVHDMTCLGRGRRDVEPVPKGKVDVFIEVTAENSTGTTSNAESASAELESHSRIINTTPWSNFSQEQRALVPTITSIRTGIPTRIQTHSFHLTMLEMAHPHFLETIFPHESGG